MDGDADETVGLPSGPKDDVRCSMASVMGSSAESSCGPGDPWIVRTACRQLESSASVLVMSEPDEKSRRKLTGLIMQPALSLPAVRKASVAVTNACTSEASTTVARYTTLFGLETSVSVTDTAVTPGESGRVSWPS